MPLAGSPPPTSSMRDQDSAIPVAGEVECGGAEGRGLQVQRRNLRRGVGQLEEAARRREALVQPHDREPLEVDGRVAEVFELAMERSSSRGGFGKAYRRGVSPDALASRSIAAEV